MHYVQAPEAQDEILWTVKMLDGTQHRLPLAKAERVAMYAAAHQRANVHKSTADRCITLTAQPH